MPYDSKEEIQRARYLAQLGLSSSRDTNLELLFQYLGSLGFTQRTLVERVSASGFSYVTGLPTVSLLSTGFLMEDNTSYLLLESGDYLLQEG